MKLLLTELTTPPRAFELAADRGLLPSALGSREQREEFAAALRSKSVFSARVTSAEHLGGIREVVKLVLSGKMDFAEARMILGQTLDALGYTPEGGFDGDEGQVPPAIKGTLQDLRSRRRLELILNTQIDLMQGAAQAQAGQDDLALYPAWELIRLGQRRVPRFWPTRFEEAGGDLLGKGAGGIGGRMIAHKNDPVWAALGDSALFDDALDVSHPPFAFNSGMGWREVSLPAFRRLGGGLGSEAKREVPDKAPLPPNVGTVRAEDVPKVTEGFQEDDDDPFSQANLEKALAKKKIRVKRLTELEDVRLRKENAERYGLASVGEEDPQ